MQNCLSIATPVPEASRLRWYSDRWAIPMFRTSAALPLITERWKGTLKVVIVGGVAGGATAAARIRRLDEQAQIVVFERSGYISYANCGLPYYIGGVIEDPEDLTLQTPESFFSRFRIHMKVRHEVTAIHPDKKTVSVKNLKTGEKFEESYATLDDSFLR